MVGKSRVEAESVSIIGIVDQFRLAPVRKQSSIEYLENLVAQSAVRTHDDVMAASLVVHDIA
ncbi:hypothetical protein ASE65_16995 [Sphingomonas sp. Leaf16]|nr:hypothetical protein ASE65_16995 [Sphingomonas sp. Leaf16]KQN15163.1 hypothetical protein ASE81_17010 [Sphingomonas sp. Leaf29]